jgi:hypothetical protein
VKITKSRTDALSLTEDSEDGTDTLRLEHTNTDCVPTGLRLTLTSKANSITLNAEAQRELLSWLSIRVSAKVGSGDPL